MAYEMNPAVFQNRFWLKIASDHIEFILAAISPNEKDEIMTARSLMTLLEGLLARARKTLEADELKQLNEQAFRIVQDERKFFLHLLIRQLTGQIELDILPGIVNRIVNETEEYLNILGTLLKTGRFVIPPLRLHLLWLMDGAGHASMIADNINLSYIDIRNSARDFEREFLILHNRAIEMQGLFRTGLQNFPAFDQFHTDVEELMTKFVEFFVQVNNKIRSKKVLGTITSLWLDHMYREECYYLTELSRVCDIKAPVCDATSIEFNF